MSGARWEDVLRVALLGTERASLPAGLAPIPGGEAPALDPLVAAASVDRSPEHGLLAVAGLLWLARRAGRRVATRADDATFPLAPTECLPELGHRSVEIIDRFMHLETPLLDAWLEASAARGRLAPRLRLCALLDDGVEHCERRTRIAAVLGARGRWLAAQNPDWSWVAALHDAGTNPEETWRLGLLEERATVLGRLRATDPARARNLLRTTWSKDGGVARAVFIDALAVGLCDDDESFLEEALDDKRATVRTAAARLLARLPGSRLVARMTARLDRLLSLGVDPDLRLPAHLRGKETLFVALPNACDEAMLRDGMLAKAPHFRAGVGQRAWWLLQLLAAVPPSHHTRRFRREPRAIVDAAAGNEHARILLEGLRDATVMHADVEMATALVDAALDASSRRGANDVHPALDVALVRLLPPALRAARALEALRPPLRDDHPVLPLVEACDFPWDEALAQAFIRAIRASMGVPVGESQAVRRLLERAVLSFPTSCIGFAGMGWPLTERVPAASWVHAYDTFLEVLRLREEAWAALDDVLAPDRPVSARNHVHSAVFENDAGTDSATMR